MVPCSDCSINPTTGPSLWVRGGSQRAAGEAEASYRDLCCLCSVEMFLPLTFEQGDKKDMVGPGNYDPVLEPTRPKVRSFDFGRSKSARADLSFLTASEIPGPGAYSSRKQEEGTEVVPQVRC
mmetsp:Transcript_19491/g.64589  ORF Transcript_19491/g.64589 Transcript_19491/m.64589 type:complete len:123 (-) Transcript_19491:129-497(-)